MDDISSVNPKLESFVLLMKYYKRNLVNKSDIEKMDFVLRQFLHIYQTKQHTNAFISPNNLIEKYDRFSLNSIFQFLV